MTQDPLGEQASDQHSSLDPQDSPEAQSSGRRTGADLDPKSVSQVLGDHMKTLRSSTDWGIAIATMTLLTAVTGIEYEILGVKTQGVWAYYTAGFIYLAVVTALGCQLLRLGYLLEVTRELVETATFEKHYIQLILPIITYSWFFNPFSYCGGMRVEDDEKHEGRDKHEKQRFSWSFRNFVGSAGGVALILAWWIGFIGLSQISSKVEIARHWEYLVAYAMLLAGLFVLYAVWSVLCRLSRILIDTRPQREDKLEYYEATVGARLVAIGAIQVVMIFSSLLFLSLSEWLWKVLPTFSVFWLLIKFGIDFKKEYLAQSS